MNSIFFNEIFVLIKSKNINVNFFFLMTRNFLKKNTDVQHKSG